MKRDMEDIEKIFKQRFSDECDEVGFRWVYTETHSPNYKDDKSLIFGKKQCTDDELKRHFYVLNNSENFWETAYFFLIKNI